MTFSLQKRAILVCVPVKGLFPYRYDLLCQIMILPYSHSLSVRSVARNGYGYIGTCRGEIPVGYEQQPLDCLKRDLLKGGVVFYARFKYALMGALSFNC